jgi:hypothetical protein
MPIKTRRICEHGEYDPPRCRKHATLAVVYRSLFATRTTGQGDVPIYMARVTFRCPGHQEAAGYDVVERIGISDYFTQLVPSTAGEGGK